MLARNAIGVAVLATALCLPLSGALSQDASKLPSNWEGQWGRMSRLSIWDDSKPPGLGQQAPLTPEYQKVLEANLKKQEQGKDFDPKGNCVPPGMPRMMMIYQPMEIILKPNVAYFLVESTSPIRRVYTDGTRLAQDLPAGLRGLFDRPVARRGQGRPLRHAHDRDARHQRPSPCGRQHPAARERLDRGEGAHLARQEQSGCHGQRDHHDRRCVHASPGP